MRDLIGNVIFYTINLSFELREHTQTVGIWIQYDIKITHIIHWKKICNATPPLVNKNNMQLKKLVEYDYKENYLVSVHDKHTHNHEAP